MSTPFENQADRRLLNPNFFEYRTSVQLASAGLKTNRIQSLTTSQNGVNVIGGVSSTQGLEVSVPRDFVNIKSAPPSAGQVLLISSRYPPLEAQWGDTVSGDFTDATYVIHNTDTRLPNSYEGLISPPLIENIQPTQPRTLEVTLPDSGVTSGTYINPDVTLDDFGFITAVANPFPGGSSPVNPTFDGLVNIDSVVDNGSYFHNLLKMTRYIFRLNITTPPSFVGLFATFNINNVPLTPIDPSLIPTDFGTSGRGVLQASIAQIAPRNVDVRVNPPNNITFTIPLSQILTDTTYSIEVLLTYPEIVSP